MKRRDFLSYAGAAATLAVSGSAAATLMRGLTLPELVNRSAHVVLIKPLDSSCRYDSVGGRKCIVTETLVRVDDVLARTVPHAAEIVVRTLGGRIAGVRELVHGQPRLPAEKSLVAFLIGDDSANLWFVGMAQGHYPLNGPLGPDVKLGVSPELPALLHPETSAVRVLSHKKLTLARRLIQDAVRP